MRPSVSKETDGLRLLHTNPKKFTGYKRAAKTSSPCSNFFQVPTEVNLLRKRRAKDFKILPTDYEHAQSLRNTMDDEMQIIPFQKFVHNTIVTRDMVWKLGELQSVYNELQFNVETASPCTNILKFC